MFFKHMKTMKLINTRWIFFLFLSSVLSACQLAGVTVSDQQATLNDWKRAIVSVMGKPRKETKGQRSFISEYFSCNEDPKFNPETSQRRCYAEMDILGDRRPYDLRITVQVEEKDSGRYVNIDDDEKLAKRLVSEIREKLHQGRENRNLIDDFRPF